MATACVSLFRAAPYRPIIVRITHSEQSLVTALDFMVEKMTATPLRRDILIGGEHYAGYR